MCEHSKEILLSCHLGNEDLHNDAFLSILPGYSIFVVFQKEGEESETNNWPVLSRSQYSLGLFFFSKSYESQSNWAYESLCPAQSTFRIRLPSVAFIIYIKKISLEQSKSLTYLPFLNHV